jgi:type I restriction enzyme S subunit
MRFPGYEKTKKVKGIPEGWTYKRVTDLLEIKYGKDHKALEEGYYPCYGSGGIMRYVAKYLFEGESVLIPRKGSLNNIMIASEAFWTIDTMFYTIPKMKNIAKYAYYMLSSVDMESLDAGAALPSMTTNILSNMDILLPAKGVLEQFESCLTPIFNSIETLTKENQTLASTRDRLLPRLLNGELKVKA